MLSAMTTRADDPPLDRRARRTRAAIHVAFNRLILERGYAGLTPAGIAEAADIGRSTFYEHFRGVDDLLAQSLGELLQPLASGCFHPLPPEEARRMVEHIWDNRRLAQVLFKDETRTIVLKSFAAAFEASLQHAVQSLDATPILSPNLIALQLAASQLAVLSEWVLGRSGHSAHEIAVALHAGGRASALTLMGALEAA